MSVEFKCDRCGKSIPPGDVSRKSGDFTIWRDNEESTFDLCKDCLDKLDIFMTGEMPAPSYRPDELAYLELPNPSVCVYEKDLLTGLGRGSEINITADLELFNRLIDSYGVTDLPLCTVEQVILGVKLR